MIIAPRSWLYVPGHRPDRVAKALSAGADAVVVDLEDAVPPEQKHTARNIVCRLLAERISTTGPQLWVRVNDPDSVSGRDDITALAGSKADGLRVPRVENPDIVARVAEQTGLPLQLLLETATGVSRAGELALAHPCVVGIGLGETDLASDLLVDDDMGLAWARGYVVIAARASGLVSPVQSVWTDVADLDGLRASTQVGLATGFFGRSIVHPRQLAVVHDVFTPTRDEMEAAREVLRIADEQRTRGEVAMLDTAGRFVDPAVVLRARVVLARGEGNANHSPGSRTVTTSTAGDTA